MKMKPVLALALTVGLAGIQPAAAQTNTGPVAANAFITFGGLDWAWAGPCFFGTPSCISSWVLADGFRFATVTEFAARPDPTAFLDPFGNFDSGVAGPMRCASAWFVVLPVFDFCNYSDATVLDAVSSGPGVYGTHGFAGIDETWLVRGAEVNVVPEPATMSLLGTGLVALIGVGRRRNKRAIG